MDSKDVLVQSVGESGIGGKCSRHIIVPDDRYSVQVVVEQSGCP